MGWGMGLWVRAGLGGRGFGFRGCFGIAQESFEEEVGEGEGEGRGVGEPLLVGGGEEEGDGKEEEGEGFAGLEDEDEEGEEGDLDARLGALEVLG